MALRTGIVGTGSVAQGNYIPALKRHDDVELMLCNRTVAKAQAAAAEAGCQAVASLDELMAWEPDAVLVLTRETDRYEAVKAILPFSPKRLFFEKPLVAAAGQESVSEQDFFDAREILAGAKACGAETAMVFNYRFFDQVMRAKAAVEERGFGKALHVTGLIHYCTWSHAIDLVHHFAGPVAEISALSSTGTRQGASMDAVDVCAAFRTEGDAAGTIVGTCGTDFQFPLFELTLSFENGRLSTRGLDGDLEILDYSGKHHELHRIVRQTSRWDQYRDSFAKSVDAYLDSVRQGAPPPVPGLAGLQELQFEAALRRSIAEKRPVDLAAEFPTELG